MNEFTASNGVSVETSGNRISVGCSGSTHPDGHQLSISETQALREFFQHERDEDLGRWRHPDDHDYVVYPNPDEAFARMFGPNLDLVVLRESDGMTKGYVRDEDQGGPPMDHRVGHILAARAYFEAHPERKPWHDARPEEVWLTGSGLHEFVAIVGYDGKFRFADGSDMAVTEEFVTGRRIWPEDAS